MESKPDEVDLKIAETNANKGDSNTTPLQDYYLSSPYARGVDINALEQELKKIIKGEVRFDEGSRALYSTDSSNYRQIPIGVIIPLHKEDIIQTIAVCRKYGAPILSRGGGTSLAGQTCNVAVVMDMSKYYNKILAIDVDRKLVRVQPGIVLDHMKIETEKLGLTFGPDPSTHNHCTIGGMLGNNSCGVHSVMSAFYGYGARMSDNITSMRVITYDGIEMEVGPTTEEEYAQIIAEGGRRAEIYSRLKGIRDQHIELIRTKFPNIPRRVSGYNLPALLPENGFNMATALVGTESTCVTILEATLKLMPKPEARTLVVLGYPDLYSSGKHIMDVLQHEPIGLEGIDDLLIGYMKKKDLNIEYLPLLPKGKAWLLVEFGGNSQEDADNKGRKLIAAIEQMPDAPTTSLVDDPAQEWKIWEVRKSGLGATAWVPGEPTTEEGWEDSAVPPEKIGEYLVDLKKLFNKYGWNPSLYGHFGQGCVHCRVPFDMLTEKGLETYKQFTIEAAHLVVKYGGSISGEHGDGQSKADLLEIMYGKELLQAFRDFKRVWDPEWKMNPGKMIEPYGQLTNLRMGVHYHPEEPKTHFQYPEEQNSFSFAMTRCVGVGECRRSSGGTMCPSYRVTNEEKHSTRGRARMLFEMLMGDVAHGWKDEHVKDSLDLCLSCKGCKGDCPVNVDMATYKAEFLSHYYKGKLRPVTAYTFGWIHKWASIASAIPGIANFVTQNKFISPIFKWIGGIAPQRKVPRFADTTFKKWFGKRNTPGQRPRPQVILWADTFNNYFLPETLIAGLEVLEAAGFEVIVPKQALCCGRPLYDFGMLDTAKKLLQNILESLSVEIEKGIPVVGLEPSCVAVFRDELCNLFPADRNAQRLKTQTYTLAEFLQLKAPQFASQIRGEALVHGHCHHKAIMKMNDDAAILKKTGLDYKILDSGCCGMAGYFGYEKGTHYDVSVKAGELVLLPQVRNAPKETFIVADGFSCRGQIEQQTDRKALHLAQVLHMGLQKDSTAPIAYPENEYLERMKRILLNKTNQ
ncbi:MAG: FAD-binding oxidoreductase [Bacteroidetes bacterium]|nr:FAD-binding oxidoreductase [Bacteroidota bacterium]